MTVILVFRVECTIIGTCSSVLLQLAAPQRVYRGSESDKPEFELTRVPNSNVYLGIKRDLPPYRTCKCPDRVSAHTGL